MSVDFSKYKFSPHYVGELFVNGRAKDEVFGETAKKRLQKIYNKEVYGVKELLKSKYIQKGLYNEEDSFTLASNVLYSFPVFKNKVTFENEYLRGTPDLLLDGEVVDFKTSWDFETFTNAKMSNIYYWQLYSYMILCGVRRASLVYCLTNTPEHLVESEKWYWKNQLGLIDLDASEKGRSISEQIFKNTNFDRISEKKKVKRFTLEFEQGVEWELYKRLDLARAELVKMSENDV